MSLRFLGRTQSRDVWHSRTVSLTLALNKPLGLLGRAASKVSLETLPRCLRKIVRFVLILVLAFVRSDSGTFTNPQYIQ